MERVFGASHPDPLEVEKAKKVLKVRGTVTCPVMLTSSSFVPKEIKYNNMQEHEQALLEAISRLGEISDGESGMPMPKHSYMFFSFYHHD